MRNGHRDDDLDLIEDEATLAVLETVRAAYVSDELPRVGIQLSAVFTDGLPGQAPSATPRAAPAEPAVPAEGRPRFRFVPSKALLAGLGAAILSVNLLAVGSVGWLPKPVQRSFEKVTRSIGVDVPAQRAVEPKAVPSRGGRTPQVDPGPTTPSGGGTGGPPGSFGRFPDVQPPTTARGSVRPEPRGGGQGSTPGPPLRPPGVTTTTPAGPPAPGKDRDAPGPTGTTVPCVPATTTTTGPPPPPGPTPTTEPPVPTTVATPIAGDAVAGAPGPPGTLPPGPPNCPP